MWYDKSVGMEALVGKVIKDIEGVEKGSLEVVITTECGNIYRFYHDQDCCEDVSLEDFIFDCDYTGATILTAEESTSDASGEENVYESGTWTFYRIDTTVGLIWLRWLGESNGYYSESVELEWVNKPQPEKGE